MTEMSARCAQLSYYTAASLRLPLLSHSAEHDLAKQEIGLRRFLPHSRRQQQTDLQLGTQTEVLNVRGAEVHALLRRNVLENGLPGLPCVDR